MKEFLLTLHNLAVTTAKRCGPGGVRSVIAEILLLKQQLIVLRRGRRRAPSLTLSDRLLCGFGSLFLSSGRIRKVAIALRPSTLVLLNSPFLLRQLMLRAALGTLLGHGLSAALAPADPPNLGTFARGAPPRNPGLAAPA